MPKPIALSIVERCAHQALESVFVSRVRFRSDLRLCFTETITINARLSSESFLSGLRMSLATVRLEQD